MRFSLDQIRKEKENIQEHQYCRFIIVGNDLPSLLLLHNLRSKFSDFESKLLFYQEPQGNEWNIPGPNLLRGVENLQLLKTLFPHLVAKEEGTASKFLKDQTFRLFSGKARPGKLLEGEEFFTYQKYDYATDSFFPEKTQLELLELGQVSNHLLGNLVQIEYLPEGQAAKDTSHKDSPPAYWRLICSENKIYECEYLFFAQGPRKFYQLLKNKDHFSSRFHEFCLKVKNHPCFILNFQGKGEVAAEEGTLFIPQSQTHEWGHFIGEFSPYDPHQKCQNFSFLSFIEENETDPENVSKKIRLMKRIVGKVFPNFSKVSVSESILITDKIPHIHEIDDQLFDLVRNELKNFSFLGMESPLTQEFLSKIDYHSPRETISHLGRALASYVQAAESLH